MSILIVSDDLDFAETLDAALHRWGMSVSRTGTAADLPGAGADIVLLDIRRQGKGGQEQLAAIRGTMPAAEIILINRPDNIPTAIAGMQAGAADELITPFDTETLKEKIAASLRRLKMRRGRKSLLKRFGEAMAAATFAQAGEFGTAVDLLDQTEERNRESSRGHKKA